MRNNKLLSQLEVGRTGKILSHHGQGAVRQRLLDLGLIPSSDITLVRTAPLGDPIEVKVGHNHVVLRMSEADTVHVALAG